MLCRLNLETKRRRGFPGHSVNDGRLSAFGALDPVKQAAAEHRLGLGISRISDDVIELNRVYLEIIQIIVRVNVRRGGFAAVHARRIHGIQEIRRADAAAAAAFADLRKRPR